MNVLKNRYIYLIISGLLMLASIAILFLGKLNLGIDMTGGINMEYSYENTVSTEKTKKEIEALAETVQYDGQKAINNIEVYGITGQKALSVVAGFVNIEDQKALDALKINFKNQIFEVIQKQDGTALETKYTNIGKSFGDYIRDQAIITLLIAIIAIAIYVSYAFSGTISGISPVSFGIITLFTLFHDVIIATGLYIFASNFFSEFQIDTFFVTALLTILGYSINDTIVIFDRIRGNLKRFAGKKGKNGKQLDEIINLSVGQTLTRSIYTSITLLFVLVAIFFFGPESLKGFILVMIFGTIVGTYSSIFIASPILYEFNKNKVLKVYEKKVINPEDKIVV